MFYIRHFIIIGLIVSGGLLKNEARAQAKEMSPGLGLFARTGILKNIRQPAEGLHALFDYPLSADNLSRIEGNIQFCFEQKYGTSNTDYVTSAFLSYGIDYQRSIIGSFADSTFGFYFSGGICSNVYNLNSYNNSPGAFTSEIQFESTWCLDAGLGVEIPMGKKVKLFGEAKACAGPQINPINNIYFSFSTGLKLFIN